MKAVPKAMCSSLSGELGKHIDVTPVSYRKGKFHDDAVAMGIDARVIKTGNIILDLIKTFETCKKIRKL